LGTVYRSITVCDKGNIGLSDARGSEGAWNFKFFFAGVPADQGKKTFHAKEGGSGKLAGDHDEVCVEN
jgi:hypothetical protein